MRARAPGRDDARPGDARARRPRRASPAEGPGRPSASRSSSSPRSRPPRGHAPSTRSPRARSTSCPSRPSARASTGSPRASSTQGPDSPPIRSGTSQCHAAQRADRAGARRPRRRAAERARPGGRDRDVDRRPACARGPASEASRSPRRGTLIVQHMPPGFTGSLAARLDRSSAAQRSRGGSGGEVLDPGTALLAPGGSHLRLADDGRTS